MSTSRINSAIAESLFSDFSDAYLSSFPQEPIIEMLQAMGYTGKKAGMCAGIIHQWEQAVMCNDEENFENRMKFIMTMYNELGDNIDKAMKQSKGVDELDKTSEEYIKAFPVELKRMLEFKIKEDPETSQLEKQQWLEVQAFFAGVELFQGMHDEHKEVFNDPMSSGADERMFQFTASHELEKRGGAIQLFQESWICEHNESGATFKQKEADLINYFEELSTILETVDESKQMPIQLSSSLHRIGVKFAGRDPMGNALWKVIDPNHMPSDVSKLLNTQLLAVEINHALKSGLNPDEHPDTAFILKMFTTADMQHSEQVQELSQKLEYFHQSHMVDDRIKQLDQRNKKELSKLSKQMGDKIQTEALKTDKTKENWKNELDKAVYFGNYRKIETLAKAGVSLNKRITSGPQLGKTIAHVAAKRGDIALLRLIDKHHGSLNKRNLAFSTSIARKPLYYAKKYNQPEAVNFIRSVKRRDALLSKLNVEGVQLSNKDNQEIAELRKSIYKDWEQYDKQGKNQEFSKDKWQSQVNDYANKIQSAKTKKVIQPNNIDAMQKQILENQTTTVLQHDNSTLFHSSNPHPVETTKLENILYSNYNSLTDKKDQQTFMNQYLELSTELKQLVLKSQSYDDLIKFQDNLRTKTFDDPAIKERELQIMDNAILWYKSNLETRFTNQPELLREILIEHNVSDAKTLVNLKLVEKNGKFYAQGLDDDYFKSTQLDAKQIEKYSGIDPNSYKETLKSELEHLHDNDHYVSTQQHQTTFIKH